jgi:hypothetical protein
MGIMTRDEMRDEVKKRINRSDFDSNIEDWLYRAILDLATYRKFYENEETDVVTQASGDNIATWPTDLLVPIRMEYVDGDNVHNCRVKGIIYIREYYSSSAGRPEFVARFGDTAYFDRDADQEYAWTLYYKGRPINFADGDATSSLNGEWDEALIRHASHSAFSALREWELATYYLKSYYAYVKGRLGDVEETEGAWNESLVGNIDYDPYTF